MKKTYVLKTFLTLCLSVASVWFCIIVINVFQEKALAKNFIFQPIVSQNTQSPHKHPILLELHIADQAAQKKIVSVFFDSQVLPLKSSNHRGDHGIVHLQVTPGTYLIRWKVESDSYAWPRMKEFYKTISIDNSNLWLKVEIKGDLITLL